MPLPQPPARQGEAQLLQQSNDDLLDPDVGGRYRDTVLAPAGTAPAAELVERFLGPPFNADA